MRVHYVVAEKLGFAPLLTEGPMADLRYKFVLIEQEFAYGNVRHHLDLVGWLLQGPLSTKYPTALVKARPIIEAENILTVFGGLTYRGEIELIPYITPPTMAAEEIERLVTELMVTNIPVQELATNLTGNIR